MENEPATPIKNARHPGEVLHTDFLKPCGLTPFRLSAALRVTPQRISEIICQRRGVTAETALRLARFFGTTAKFWLDLQTDYELTIAQEKWGTSIEDEIRPLPRSMIMSFVPVEDEPQYLRECNVQVASEESSRESLAPVASVESPRESLAPVAKVSTEISVQLTESQDKIVNILSEGSLHFDALCAKSGFSAGELSSTLTMLELEGFVQRHPGDHYSKCRRPAR